MRHLYALLALQALLVLHEVSHAVMARLLGIAVRRISIGFGPPLFSFRAGGTLVALCAVPLGAFTGLNETGPGAFSTQPLGKRLLVLLAGPFSNLAAAFLILFGLHLWGTHVAVPMTVGAVEPGSEAARAQLRPGDLILAVDGERLEQWSALVTRVSDAPEVPLALSVGREGTTVQLEVTPRRNPEGLGTLGLSQQYVYREHSAGEAAAKALQRALRLATDGLSQLERMARGGRAAWLPSAVPLFDQASLVASTGLDAFFRVAAALSLALAGLTLLPVPSLDGGRLSLLAIEAITGARPGPRLQKWLHAVGFLVLVILVLALAARAMTAGRP